MKLLFDLNLHQNLTKFGVIKVNRLYKNDKALLSSTCLMLVDVLV